jgi:hypothetical protein
MIDWQKGQIVIECDSCNEVFDGRPHEDFSAVWSAAKEEGWTARKIADEWLHGCPDCGAPA